MASWAAIASRSRLNKAFSSHGFSLIRWFSTTHPPLERVGFVGLGNMGHHMAANLTKAGYQVVVHDLNHDTMNNFLEKGVAIKDTPSELADSSDVVITMLPSPSDVLDVFTGPTGLLQGQTTRPWLFIDSSTVDPQTSRRVSSCISKCTLKSKKGDMRIPTMLDAPVSGGVPGAQTATLTFMVGGLEEAFLAAKPLFHTMGKNTIYCGGTGTGSAAKICNNLVMAVSMLGVSEAFALGQRLGITCGVLNDVINSSSGQCWSSESYNPVPGVMEGAPSSRNYDGGFSSKLMAKDLGLALASMKEVDLSSPLTALAENIYKETCRSGHQSKDFSCVFRHFYNGKDDI